MNHTHLLIYSAIFVTLGMTSCDNTTTYVTTVPKMAAEGLNLEAVTDLATKVKTPQEFEEKLNKPGNLINNLDLNEDEIVDFIKITEINDETGKGFSLSTEVAPNDEQELAVIQFEEQEGNAVVQAHGNSHLYGNHHYYHRSYGLTDLLIWNYYLGGHRRYSSPYGYNNHPSYFQSQSTRSASKYSNHHKSQAYTKGFTQTTRPAVSKSLTSPNRNKTATQIKAPLRNPTTSQKKYQLSNPSKSRPKPKSNSFSSSKYRSSSSSRSRSSFGGGK